jgi:hypothetical protein
MGNGAVRFNGKIIALAGLLVAAGMAIGLPAMILLFGQGLGTAVQTTLIILALVGGAVLGIVSAFFGIVIPSSVAGHDYSHWGRRHVKVVKDGDRKTVEIGGEEPASPDADNPPSPGQPPQ